MEHTHDFNPEEFLGNITEIKQAQVNCATTDDLNSFKQEIDDFAPPRPELPTTMPADCLCHRLYDD